MDPSDARLSRYEVAKGRAYRSRVSSLGDFVCVHFQPYRVPSRGNCRIKARDVTLDDCRKCSSRTDIGVNAVEKREEAVTVFLSEEAESTLARKGESWLDLIWRVRGDTLLRKKVFFTLRFCRGPAEVRRMGDRDLLKLVRAEMQEREDGSSDVPDEDNDADAPEVSRAHAREPRETVAGLEEDEVLDYLWRKMERDNGFRRPRGGSKMNGGVVEKVDGSLPAEDFYIQSGLGEKGFPEPSRGATLNQYLLFLDDQSEEEDCIPHNWIEVVAEALGVDYKVLDDHLKALLNGSAGDDNRQGEDGTPWRSGERSRTRIQWDRTLDPVFLNILDQRGLPAPVQGGMTYAEYRDSVFESIDARKRAVLAAVFGITLNSLRVAFRERRGTDQSPTMTKPEREKSMPKMKPVKPTPRPHLPSPPVPSTEPSPTPPPPPIQSPHDITRADLNTALLEGALACLSEAGLLPSLVEDMKVHATDVGMDLILNIVELALVDSRCSVQLDVILTAFGRTPLDLYRISHPEE